MKENPVKTQVKEETKFVSVSKKVEKKVKAQKQEAKKIVKPTKQVEKYVGKVVKRKTAKESLSTEKNTKKQREKSVVEKTRKKQAKRTQKNLKQVVLGSLNEQKEHYIGAVEGGAQIVVGTAKGLVDLGEYLQNCSAGKVVDKITGKTTYGQKCENSNKKIVDETVSTAKAISGGAEYFTKCLTTEDNMKKNLEYCAQSGVVVGRRFKKYHDDFNALSTREKQKIIAEIEYPIIVGGKVKEVPKVFRPFDSAYSVKNQSRVIEQVGGVMKLVREKLDRFGIKIFETSYNKEAAEFFDDVVGYEDTVLNKFNGFDYHTFPELVEKNFSEYGRVEKIIGGDGESRSLLRIKGAYRGVDGNFEFIKDDGGVITHRLFRPIKN